MTMPPLAWTGHRSTRQAQGKSGCLMVLPVAAIMIAAVLCLII